MTAEPLLRLLDHLAADAPRAPAAWRGWQIRRIGGGHNGIVYQAAGGEGNLAVKFTRRDERDRAGPAARWQWFVDGCAAGRGDPTFTVRVHTYSALNLVWWAARFARVGYEIDHGLEEQRLAPRPAGWRESVPRQYACCLERARAALVTQAQRDP